MARDYAVTVTASRTAVDPAVLAARLAEVLGEALEEVEASVRAGTVIVQGQLSYGEALVLQRELAKRQIPCAVAPAANSDLVGVRDFSRTREPEEELQGAPPDEEPGEEEPIEERPVTASGAWGELFPDLDEEERQEEEGGDEAFFAELQAAEASARAGSAPPPVITPATPSGPVARASREVPGEREHLQAALAITDQEVGRPPYQPRGYDPRPPHVSLIAAILSGVAPGAGQVFNGQPEKARGYSWKFVALYPWVQSVRDAWRIGEKIRTYYAPRPAPEAAKAAVVYVSKFWVTLILILFSVSWIAGAVQEFRAEQRELQERRVFRELLHYGLDAVADAVEEGEEEARIEGREREARAVVERQERARRLFIVGYHQCLSGEYDLCAAAMRRVNTLGQENADARRLQAWATVKAQARDSELSMPDVGFVPTLEEFELELAGEGESLEEFVESEGIP